MTNPTMLAGKGISLLAFFLILSSLSFAIDDCSRNQNLQDLPCYVTLNTNTCNNVYIQIFSQNTSLNYSLMTQYSPTRCSYLFNFTTLGTYNFNYSTGDTGLIVVEEGNTMMTLLIVGILIAAMLLILGVQKDLDWIVAIGGMLTLILGIWFIRFGFSIYNNMITLMLGGIFAGIGGYYTFIATLKMIEGDSGGFE